MLLLSRMPLLKSGPLNGAKTVAFLVSGGSVAP
jgi:hypothetical protein